MTFSFADYRKTGSVMLPFYFEIGTYLKLRLNEIKLNVEIDASRFEKKKNCFDVAN